MRKIVTMALTVSVPSTMTAREARREVRSLINDQCNWSADPGDVKVRKLTPPRPSETFTRMIAEAHGG